MLHYWTLVPHFTRGAVHPGILHCDRSGLRAGRRWWHRGRTGWAVCRVVTLDFRHRGGARIAHCFDAIRRFLVHDDLLLHSRGLANHCLLIGLRSPSMVRSVSRHPLLSRPPMRDADRSRRARNAALHSPPPGVSTTKRRMRVVPRGLRGSLPIVSCSSEIGMTSSSPSRRAAPCAPRVPAGAGGTAVRAKTKGGGALVDVNRLVPLQDFSNPIDCSSGTLTVTTDEPLSRLRS